MPAVTAFLADGLGFAGSLAACSWSFARSRRRMLAVQMAGSCCFLAHWALQGRATAAAMTGLLLGMAVLSLFLEGPADSPRVRRVRRFYLAALLPIIGFAALTWSGLPSLFAAIGTAMGCYGRWQTDPARHRAVLLASSVPWLAHNLLVGSVPGMCTDLFGLGRAAWLAWGARPRGFGARLGRPGAQLGRPGARLAGG